MKDDFSQLLLLFTLIFFARELVGHSEGLELWSQILNSYICMNLFTQIIFLNDVYTNTFSQS